MSPDTSSWGRLAAGAAVAWLVAWWLLSALQLQPHPVPLALVMAVIALAWWQVAEVAAAQRRPQWSAHGLDMHDPVRGDPRLNRVHRLLKDSPTSPHASDHLRTMLATLADDLLHERHGVSWSTDPTRAAELLGPDLTRLLTDPSSAPPLAPSQLAIVIDRIESL